MWDLLYKTASRIKSNLCYCLLILAVYALHCSYFYVVAIAVVSVDDVVVAIVIVGADLVAIVDVVLAICTVVDVVAIVVVDHFVAVVVVTTHFVAIVVVFVLHVFAAINYCWKIK